MSGDLKIFVNGYVVHTYYNAFDTCQYETAICKRSSNRWVLVERYKDETRVEDRHLYWITFVRDNKPEKLFSIVREEYVDL